MIRRTTNAAASCSGRFFIDRYRRRRRRRRCSHRYDHRYHRSRCAEIREIMENNSDYIGAHPVNTSGRVCPRARERASLSARRSHIVFAPDALLPSYAHDNTIPRDPGDVNSWQARFRR